MQELINRLMEKGLTEAQAYAAIEVIKNFAKEKFPVFGGAIEKLFEKYSPKDEEDFLDWGTKSKNPHEAGFLSRS